MRRLFRIIFVVAALLLAFLGRRSVVHAVQQGAVQSENVAKPYPAVDDALLIFRRGNADGALQLLIDAKKKHPELPPAEVMLARFWFAHNQTEQGKNALQQAVAVSPNDPEAYLLLAEISAASNDLVQADTLFDRGFQKCESLAKDSPRYNSLAVLSLSGRSTIAERRQLWDEAETHLQTLLELEPNNATTVDRLARVLFFRKQYDAAKAMFVRWKELNASALPPEVQMGLLYEQTNQRELAKTEMNTASAKYAKDLETRVAVANWALFVGDLELADKNIAAALQIDPQTISGRLLQGIAFLFRGQPQQAETILRAVHNDAPSNFDAIHQLALSLTAQDDPKKQRLAVEYADLNRRANADMRTDAGRTAAGTCAWTLYRNQNLPAAQQVLVAVLQAGQFSPQVSYFAAEILAASGDRDLAGKLAQASIDSPRTFPERARAAELTKRLNDPQAAK
jgi:tetratricopeptide (TPR) repeat protein